MSDRSIIADQIHAELRAILVEKFFLTPQELVASALAYELTSVLAMNATTPALGQEAIRRFAAHMQEQMRTHGVGKPHPVAKELVWTH